MKSTPSVILVLAALSIASCSFGAQAPKGHPVKKGPNKAGKTDWKAVYRVRGSLYQTRKVDAIASQWTPDFVMVTDDGRTLDSLYGKLTMPKWMALMKELKATWTFSKIVDKGNTATISGTYKFAGNLGPPFDKSPNFYVRKGTEVVSWIKTPMGWRINKLVVTSATTSTNGVVFTNPKAGHGN